MVRVAKMKYFNIYSNMQNSYIIHNTRKPFTDGHTHINNFNTAKYITYLALYKKLPKQKHLSLYLFDSLIRISDDTTYINKISSLKHMEETKKLQKHPS